MPRRSRMAETENLEAQLEEDVLPDDIDFAETDTETPPQSQALSEEPLFSTLLLSVVTKQWPDDSVMADFVTHVAGPLSSLLGTKGAKGGNFFAVRAEAGESPEVGYKLDQSFRAHLINGLFPVLHIARALKNWEAPRFRYWDDRAQRLFIAGYVLHDWVKLPEVEEELRAVGLSHDTVDIIQHRELIETIFLRWSQQLGLETFLAAIGGPEAVLHDLIYIAFNTQVKWGTVHNLSALPRLSPDGRLLRLCENLSTLADLISYVAPTPRDLTAHYRIRSLISNLSDNTARLVHHHVADNRGILTNLIHNAALEEARCSTRIPFLYAPSGVVYLEHKDTPPFPDVSTVAAAVIQRVRQVSATQLGRSLTGFKRDGKGLKRADYYDLFFSLDEQIQLAAQAAFKQISQSKAPSAGKRFTKMRDGGWLAETAALDLPDDIRVDQLAEWIYLAETLIGARAQDFDTADFVLNKLDLADLREAFDAVPRDNRAGGVGYHWYFAAGHYLKRHPGRSPDEWQTLVEGLAEELAAALVEKHASTLSSENSWQELETYVQEMFSFGPKEEASSTNRSLFFAEFNRYQDAKRTGRGRTAICGLCSSPFTVTKQQESAILFAPQVYSNKLPLHGATAIRDICSICGLETMLRQILMNHSNTSGSRFEGRQVRYLHFYPMYFFSPETLEIFRTIHDRLRRLSFTELRRQLINETASGNTNSLAFQAAIWQRLEPLLLSAEDISSSETDRYVRMHFPEHEPITFYFLGIPPPSREAKDAEAWVHPAFLALLLPVCLDVKVVASTSPLPLLLEAREMNETVFLDGAHPFVQSLVGRERINIDQILPSLQRLATGYFIHLDANSRQTRGQWDYRWSDIPPLARDLAADPAYACHYLKKWQRRNGHDDIPTRKAQQFVAYLNVLGKDLDHQDASSKETERKEKGQTMSAAQTLVDLSRQFYRARRQNSNSILRPLSVGAKAILTADPRLFDREGLIEVVRGELSAFMERVKTGSADGFFPPGSNAESREEAMQKFAEYFAGTLFHDIFRRDVAALRGRQLNLLRSAYEVLYRDASARDRQERQMVETEGEVTNSEE